MTKEDALFFLGRFRTEGINEKLYDALGVAIEALNTQTKTHGNRTETHACDLISRQAAIDAPVKMVSDGLEWVPVYHLKELPSAQRWIPVTERLPEEDHWLGGSGRQFSEKVMVTIVNHSDEDTWVDMTQTIDGEWACELPKYCEIVAWMPLPEPYKEHPDAD